MPVGVQPLPLDNRSCDPTYDERRYLNSTGTEWVAYAVHGMVCLDDGRYADALPDLAIAAKQEPSPRNLVALGVAYDGIGNYAEARNAWSRARNAFSHQYPAQNQNFVNPLGLESDVLDNRSLIALGTLDRYFNPKTYQNQSAPFNKITFDDLGITSQFVNALKAAASGHPAQGAEMISALYKTGPYFGELRYARAIMLLADNRRGEARIELRLAARTNSVYSSDWGPYDFQWSSITLLERLQR